MHLCNTKILPFLFLPDFLQFVTDRDPVYPNSLEPGFVHNSAFLYLYPNIYIYFVINIRIIIKRLLYSRNFVKVQKFVVNLKYHPAAEETSEDLNFEVPK